MAVMMNSLRSKTLLGTFSSRSTHMVGNGFHVRNMFPSNNLGQRLSPFILLDLAGPTFYPGTDTPRGVGEHPHRGFETVTLVYQGKVSHRDSGGNAGLIGPGDVQWMTAASGVVHEEKHEREFAKEGGTLQMAQLWVNLPKKDKMSPPSYQDIGARQIPSVAVDGGEVRVIAGEYGDTRGPAKTFTPVNFWDVRLSGGHEIDLKVPAGQNTGVVVFEGRASVNGSDEIQDAQMVWLDTNGELVSIKAVEDSKLLLLSGTPLDEPIASHGPFVMNTEAEIHQAIKDYQSGKMGHLD